MKHSLSTVEKLGLQFLLPFDTLEITFFPCLHSDFAAHLLHRKSSNLGNIYQPQDELGNIPPGRDDDNLASWQSLPEPSPAMCNQPYFYWAALTSYWTETLLSLALTVIWFIDEHKRVLSKDNTEKFGEATAAPVFNRAETTMQQQRSSDNSLWPRGNIMVSKGFWTSPLCFFRSSFLGVTLWFILTS